MSNIALRLLVKEAAKNIAHEDRIKILASKHKALVEKVFQNIVEH